jgi:DNA invertase Pin-like site-specific DNA recombinase
MSNTEINRVCAYLTVNTRKEKQEGRHEKQRNRLKSWAEKNDIEVDFYEDITVSGQSDRHQYEIMMGRLDEYDALVVRKLSRLGNDLEKILKDIGKLEAEGVEFISLTEGFDTSSPRGKLLFEVVAGFNRCYKDMRKETLRRTDPKTQKGKHGGRTKKLSDDEAKQCEEWREKGLSYDDISRMVKLEYGKEIDRSTVYRYLNEE